MLQYLADENFNFDIVRGMLRRQPDLDIVRVQDTPVNQADDPTVLGFAANANRILLTHDRRTIPHYAWERVRNGQAMPGVFVSARNVPVGVAIEELLLLALCSDMFEWDLQVQFFPL